MKNVLLLGAGAIGSVYADKLCKYKQCRFAIAADAARVEKYNREGIKFCGENINARFLTPDGSQTADIILVAVKNYSLKEALKVIAPAVNENTIIVSLMNGITSETVISKRFPTARVIYGYYIGHTSTRKGNNTFQDGNYMTVIGNPSKAATTVASILSDAGIHIEVRDNMVTEMWKKFTVNVCLNQTTAFFGCTYGEIVGEKRLFFNMLADEVQTVAICESIPGAEGFAEYAKKVLGMMNPTDRSSMAQDVQAGRRTEVEDFAGEVVRLATKHQLIVHANLEVLKKFTLQ